MCSNYPGIKLEPALGTLEDKLKICHHMLTSSTQLQNRPFHVVERTRTSSKCQKMKNARAKRAKILFFYCQICKFVGFLLPSSSCLLKLSIYCVRPKGERKPNFVFASCVFRVGVPVYGYAEFFEIAVRTPKWPPRLIFAGACVGRETGANL